MDMTAYRELQAQARRLTRSVEDAQDLVHDTLVAALQVGRSDLPWLMGVLRKQAALAVRTAVRRRRRETAVVAESVLVSMPDAATACDPRRLLARLPPAARRVAVLALHGLDASEIRWILGLTPTAFRQRLTSIRKGIVGLPGELQAESLALAEASDPARSADLPFGLVRRALKAALQGHGMGTHDPDGHLLVVRAHAHTSPGHGN